MFFLNCSDGPPELRENRGFDNRRLGRVVEVLTPYLGELCERWRAIHGDH